MKKLFLMLVVAVMVGLPSQAFAKQKPVTDFNQFRMVASGSAESFGKKDPNGLKTFGWTQPIFAFVKLDSKLSRDTDVTFKWIAPDTTSSLSYITTTFPSNRKGWAPFTIDRQAGLWNVEASFINQFGTTTTKTREFIISPGPELLTLTRQFAPTNIVAPEPMSLILYGLGGLPIAAHLLRRRKTATKV